MNQQISKDVNPEAIEAILDKFGLFWGVQKEPLFLEGGETTQFFGTVRQDTRKVFASVKEGYEIYQNWELAELVYRVAEELDSAVVKGGYFDDGGKVFLQVKRPGGRVGESDIELHATAINAHDATLGLRWGGTATDIVCRNTFYMAYHSLDNRLRHTKNLRSAIERSLKAIETIDQEDKSLLETWLKFADTKVKPEQVVDVVKAVTGIDSRLTEKEAKEKYSTRSINLAQDLGESIGLEMSRRGETVWGLWSGLTHYTTHKAGTDKARAKSKATGALQSTDNKVFELLKSFIEKPTISFN